MVYGVRCSSRGRTHLPLAQPIASAVHRVNSPPEAPVEANGPRPVQPPMLGRTKPPVPKTARLTSPATATGRATGGVLLRARGVVVATPIAKHGLFARDTSPTGKGWGLVAATAPCRCTYAVMGARACVGDGELEKGDRPIGVTLPNTGELRTVGVPGSSVT